MNLLLILATLTAVDPAPDSRAQDVPARIRAAREITISAEVGGRVIERPVARSSLVKKGQLILVIDPVFHQLAVRGREAALEKAHAAAKLAAAELKRIQTMSESDSVPESTRDAAEAENSGAAADVRAAEVLLDEARERLRRTRLTAPEDGALTEILPEIGELVKPGAPVARLLTVQDLVAESFVAPEVVHGLRVGQSVGVRVTLPQEKVLPARIREVALAAGEARTFRLVVAIENPPPELRAGFEGWLVFPRLR